MLRTLLIKTPTGQTAACAAFFLTAIAALAQTPAPPVNLAGTETRTLTSTKIGQRYDLLVSLPDGYAKSRQSYPVLYVLDGWHFPFLAFLQNNNINSQRMRPVIMVNVRHVPASAQMALRARDFTPTKTLREANSGGAPLFLDFLEHELIPFVDRTYRTIPSDRALGRPLLRRTVCDLRPGKPPRALPANRRREPRPGLG